MVRIVGNRNLEPAPFSDEVHDMADFVKAHPQILGDDVVIVSRELEHGQDGRRMDFLVYDTESGQAGIVEIKKDHADEKSLLQTLRYADWLRNNPDTIRYQVSRQKDLGIDPEDIDVDAIKIYIVAPKIAAAVAELSQYVSGFDFEFIQLQRFKDSAGEVCAVTSPLDVQTRTVAPGRQRFEHDPASYTQSGVSDDRIEVVQTAVRELIVICEAEGWELAPRHLKGAIKFQTGGGKNVFLVAIKKQKDHFLRFCLGKAFSLSSAEMEDSVGRALKQKKPDSNWWFLPLGTARMEAYRPLLRLAHLNVVG